MLSCLTGPDSRARGLVRGGTTLVDVNLGCVSIQTGISVGFSLSAYHDTGVRLGSVGGDGGQVAGGGSCGTRAGNLQLGALGVELRSVGLVESQKLVADEVVAGLEGLGDGAGPLQVVQDVGGTPVVAVQDAAGKTLLVDLEPLLALAVAGGELAVTGVHPHHHGALSVRPLLPERGYGAAGRDLGGEGRGRAAVAGHLGVRDGHDGVVVGPLSLNDLRAGDRGEALVALVGLAADLVAGHRAVGGDHGGGEEQSKVGPHLDFWWQE